MNKKVSNDVVQNIKNFMPLKMSSNKIVSPVIVNSSFDRDGLKKS